MTYFTAYVYNICRAYEKIDSAREKEIKVLPLQTEHKHSKWAKGLKVYSLREVGGPWTLKKFENISSSG